MIEAAIAWTASSAAMADLVVSVSVDISALANGQVGDLQFVFNPDLGSTYDAATVEISQIAVANSQGGYVGDNPFHGGGSSQADAGSATGKDYFITNSDPNENDVSFNYTFGTNSSLSFLLTFSGPAISNPSNSANGGTTFSFALTDTNYNPILGDPNNDGSGTLLTAYIPPGSNALTVSSLESQVKTNGPNDSTASPEPSTLALGLLGAAVLAVYGRKKAVAASHPH